jgi:hypothetical protein
MPAPTMWDGQWLEDEGLKKWATPRQLDYIEATVRLGSLRKAAAELGINNSTISKALTSLRDYAARRGHAPGHFSDGTAPGYRMGKVTIQRARTGDGSSVVERVWERQHPDDDLRERLFLARVEGLKDDLPRVLPLSAPVCSDDELLTVYPQGDPHAGLYAWSEEVGEGFDLAAFERINIAATDQLVASAPPSPKPC